MRLGGCISRLVAETVDEEGKRVPARVFVNPYTGQELPYVDGRHFSGAGELIVEAPIEGRAIGLPVDLEYSDDADPNARTLRIR